MSSLTHMEYFNAVHLQWRVKPVHIITRSHTLHTEHKSVLMIERV